MTKKKPTTIMRALERCSGDGLCQGCPWQKYGKACIDTLMKEAADTIGSYIAKEEPK